MSYKVREDFVRLQDERFETFLIKNSKNGKLNREKVPVTKFVGIDRVKS